MGRLCIGVFAPGDGRYVFGFCMPAMCKNGVGASEKTGIATNWNVLFKEDDMQGLHQTHCCLSLRIYANNRP